MLISFIHSTRHTWSTSRPCPQQEVHFNASLSEDNQYPLQSYLVTAAFFSLLQEFVLNKLLSGRKVTNVGKAQVKITALIVYVTIVGVVGLVTKTRLVLTYDAYGEDLTENILCLTVGGSDCTLDQTPFNTVTTLVTTFLFLLSFIPMMVIFLICDPMAFKRKYKAWKSMITSNINV